MNRETVGIAATLALAVSAFAQQPPSNAPARPQTGPPTTQQQQQPPAAPQTHLKVGDPAPDFTLRDTEGKEVKLSDFKHKRSVVLAFYVLAFTGG